MKGKTCAFRTQETRVGWYCRKEESNVGFPRGSLVYDGKLAPSGISLGLFDEQPLYGSNAIVVVTS